MDFAISERPNTLSELVGNSKLKTVLQSCLDNGTVPQAIMFTGDSSSGKSTLVNILKNELSVDELNFIELDCGLLLNIEMVRDLSQQLQFPAIGSKRMVVLEECHKLSGSKKVQEAFLRLLENIPEDTYIVSTTTNPEQLLKQFVNRFTQMKLSSLSERELLLGIIRPVLDKYGFMISKEIAKDLIATSNGVVRDILHNLYLIHKLPESEQVVFMEKLKSTSVNFFSVYKMLASSVDGYNTYTKFVGMFPDLVAESSSTALSIGLSKLFYREMLNPSSVGNLNKACRFLEVFKEPAYDDKTFLLNIAKFLGIYV